MHVLKSMTRKDATLTTLIFVTVLLLLFGAYALVSRSLTGIYDDLEAPEQLSQLLSEDADLGDSASLDRQALRHLVLATKRPASSLISCFCAVALVATIVLLWLWHKLVYAPIHSANNFLANYHDFFQEEYCPAYLLERRSRGHHHHDYDHHRR